MKRFNKILLILLLAVMVLIPTDLYAELNPNRVVTAPIAGTVSVQMEEFIMRVIRHAEQENAGLIVFTLNTPGGLVTATREITQAILNSNVPVAMWVPPGGRATSAGSFMMQAAHVAAMAPGTNIGAARPVIASGGDVPAGDMQQKVMNDLLAHMRSLTQLRGRNEEVAQRMIVESLSLTAHEALEYNAIDIVVYDINSLLFAANGRVVEVNGQQTTINISPNAIRDNIEKSFQEQIIQFLSCPNTAYLLLAGGVLVVFYGIMTGGFTLGIGGVVMLLLGGIGLRMLPFNWAGVVLVIAGAIIIGIEIMTASTGGLLGLIGTLAMIAGGVFLFRAPGAELLNVSVNVIAGMGITLGLCFMFFATLITRSLRAKVTTGQEGIIGLDAEITEDLDPEGMVKCRGEVWRARTKGESLRKGSRAVVISIEGMILIVKAKP